METEARSFNGGAVLENFHASVDLEVGAWEKLMSYCRATDNEVSGFMVTKKDGTNFRVVDVRITHQAGTGSTTTMETDDMVALMDEIKKDWDIGEEYRISHFHTHPTFGVFWSGTDMQLRRQLSRGCEWYLFIVLNQKGDMLAALELGGEMPLSINSVPVRIIPSSKTAKKCEDEVKKFLKREAVVTVKDEQLPLGTIDSCRKSPADRYVERGEDVPWFLRDEGYTPVLDGETIMTETGLYANVAGEIVKITEEENAKP